MMKNYKLAVLIGLLLSMISATFYLLVLAVSKLPSTKSMISEEYSFKYTYVYNIEPRIFVINKSKYLFLVYSHTHPFKSVDYVYNVAKIYNLPVISYDIDKPWYGLKLANNTTIPLVPLSFVPGVFCVYNNKVMYMYLRNSKFEDVIDFISKCVNNSK